MGKHTRVIGRTILVHLSGPDDKNKLDEWLHRNDDDSLRRGYVTFGTFLHKRKWPS